MRYSNIFLIVHLIVNISCANLKLETIIENEKNDVLAGESFLRYSANRIKLVQGKGNLIQTAVTYCHQNKISKGLEILRQNLLKEKENPNYWNHVGTCYYLLNSFAKSKYYLKIALAKGINLEIEKTENKSTFYPAYNNLGLIYLKLRDYDKALLYFKLADKFM